MKKIIFIIFILFSVSSLNADYLLLNYERCASDYYYSYDTNANKYKFYYLNSKTGHWISTTSNVGAIIPGYVYDADNDVCTPPAIPQKLGIQYHEYKFLMALMGLLIGFSWLFSFLFIFARR